MTAEQAEEKDKLSRNLCPKCEAYAAFETEKGKGLVTCSVCGAQYTFKQVYG